eukprot:6249635-Pyramimonas_sp.AAC.1
MVAEREVRRVLPAAAAGAYNPSTALIRITTWGHPTRGGRPTKWTLGSTREAGTMGALPESDKKAEPLDRGWEVKEQAP